MKDDICFGHLLKGGCVHTVQSGVQEGECCHDSYCLAIGRYVSLEVAGHGNGSQEQLSTAIFGRSSASDLSK